MDVLEKKRKISSLKEGEQIDDIFVVKFKKGVSKYARGYSFELTLADDSGNIEFKHWGEDNEEKIRAIYDSIKPDSIVRAKGKISVYNGKLQFSSNENQSIIVLEKGQFNESDFIKPSKRDIKEMYNELQTAIRSVSEPKIRLLLERVFAEFGERFKNHPGAIEIHHNWKGGLLQHSLEVLKFCQTGWETFPELNKDLLIAGALLHDIGKIDEMEVTSRIKGTKKGQLIGHIVISSIIVSEKCKEIDLDEETKNKLLHLIVSHHGKKEFGAPKEPMFPEALALYYADEISSKLAEIIEFAEESRKNTEDDFMFHKRGQKNILIR